MEKSLAELVRWRARERCEYCQLPQAFSSFRFQIDHIIAQQHLGPTTEDNLALACYLCNHHKGPNIAGFDLVTESIVALFNPRRDAWYEHFQWDGPVLAALTPTGRVTVHVLAMNLDRQIELRSELLREDVFPPS